VNYLILNKLGNFVAHSIRNIPFGGDMTYSTKNASFHFGLSIALELTHPTKK